MSMQNRVDPWGEIHAVQARGAWMGNRGGRIHRPDKTLSHRRWASKQWIYCVFDFRGRSREVMGPRTYTELFFIDEITALAAGHRPCWECQNKRAKEFLEAAGGYRAPEIDAITHIQRTSPHAHGALRDLPDGAMFTFDGQALTPWEGQILVWSWQGFKVYKSPVGDEVEILTPGTYINALKAGFKPGIKLAP